MFWFQLWREFRLSIAEISSVFWDSTIPVFWNKNIFILKNLEKKEILDKANFLWWTIKIFEIEKENDFKEIILKKNITPKKFVYWVSIFWEKSNLKETLISSKKILKQNNISSRFINKNFENLNSAQIIWDKLVEKWTDFTIINSEEKIYIWKTIWVQDINEYSKRDYGKLRDIQTGMLPPKLAQIMINLSQSINWKFIYDPFVWLWTILIESGLMSFHSVYGSDINEKMIEFSNKNLSELKNKWNVFNFEIFKFDSRDIWELDSENSELAKLMQNWKVNIVTEWFLGEIMTKKNICEQRIMIQRKNLQKLYEKFFSWLKKLDFFLKYDYIFSILGIKLKIYLFWGGV